MNKIITICYYSSIIDDFNTYSYNTVYNIFSIKLLMEDLQLSKKGFIEITHIIL